MAAASCWAGAIPVDGSGGPKLIVQALRAAGDALNRGELVCLFAQGVQTRFEGEQDEGGDEEETRGQVAASK